MHTLCKRLNYTTAPLVLLDNLVESMRLIGEETPQAEIHDLHRRYKYTNTPTVSHLLVQKYKDSSITLLQPLTLQLRLLMWYQA